MDKCKIFMTEKVAGILSNPSVILPAVTWFRNSLQIHSQETPARLCAFISCLSERPHTESGQKGSLLSIKEQAEETLENYKMFMLPFSPLKYIMHLKRLLEPALFSPHGTWQQPLSKDVPVPAPRLSPPCPCSLLSWSRVGSSAPELMIEVSSV